MRVSTAVPRGKWLQHNLPPGAATGERWEGKARSCDSSYSQKRLALNITCQTQSHLQAFNSITSGFWDSYWGCLSPSMAVDPWIKFPEVSCTLSKPRSFRGAPCYQPRPGYHFSSVTEKTRQKNDSHRNQRCQTRADEHMAQLARAGGWSQPAWCRGGCVPRLCLVARKAPGKMRLRHWISSLQLKKGSE